MNKYFHLSSGCVAAGELTVQFVDGGGCIEGGCFSGASGVCEVSELPVHLVMNDNMTRIMNTANSTDLVCFPVLPVGVNGVM
jgi:hypothetical protein